MKLKNIVASLTLKANDNSFCKYHRSKQKKKKKTKNARNKLPLNC